MYFPRYAADAQDAAKPEPRMQEVPKGQPSMLVLVVEDDPRVRAVSVALLRELGTR